MGVGTATIGLPRTLAAAAVAAALVGAVLLATGPRLRSSRPA